MNDEAAEMDRSCRNNLVPSTPGNRFKDDGRRGSDLTCQVSALCPSCARWTSNSSALRLARNHVGKRLRSSTISARKVRRHDGCCVLHGSIVHADRDAVKRRPTGAALLIELQEKSKRTKGGTPPINSRILR